VAASNDRVSAGDVAPSSSDATTSAEAASQRRAPL